MLVSLKRGPHCWENDLEPGPSFLNATLGLGPCFLGLMLFVIHHHPLNTTQQFSGLEVGSSYSSQQKARSLGKLHLIIWNSSGKSAVKVSEGGAALGCFLEPLWGHKMRTQQVIGSQTGNSFIPAVEAHLAQQCSWVTHSPIYL